MPYYLDAADHSRVVAGTAHRPRYIYHNIYRNTNKKRIVTICDVSGTDLAHLLLADPEFTHDEYCGCVEDIHKSRGNLVGSEVSNQPRRGAELQRR